MFDLSRILRIRVLGIPESSFHDNPLNNNDEWRGGDLKQTIRVSGG